MGKQVAVRFGFALIFAVMGSCACVGSPPSLNSAVLPAGNGKAT